MPRTIKTTVTKPVNIPMHALRSMDISLCENYCARSDHNRQELWAEIRKLLPGMPDSEIDRLAMRDAVYEEDNAYTRAWSRAWDICENGNRFEDGPDNLPSECYEKANITDPEFPWPASCPKPVPYPYDPD